MSFQWFSNIECPMMFLWFSYNIPMISFEFPLLSQYRCSNYFPMMFLYCSYDFLVIFQCFSNIDCPLFFWWFPYYVPMMFLWSSNGFPIKIFQCSSYEFHMMLPWVSCDFPMTFKYIYICSHPPHGTPRDQKNATKNVAGIYKIYC